MTPKPPISSRFRLRPRRTPMTVCIAAACSIRREPAIVLCHDWQGTVQAVGSSDSVDKQRYLGNGWIALIAGDISHADELTALIEGSIPALPSPDIAIRSLREKVFDYRERLLDQYLRGTCGIGYERFINDGMKIYPESVFKEINRELMDVQIGVELLVTGFVVEFDDETNQPYNLHCIMQVCQSPAGVLEVSLQDSFATIGEGAAAAQASLLYREHDWQDGLQQTTYRVYEAKTMAEIIPTVGPSSTIYLHRPKHDLEYINEDGFYACRNLFKLFGPKKITRKGLKATPITTDLFEAETKTRARVGTGRKVLDGVTPSSAQTSEDQP